MNFAKLKQIFTNETFVRELFALETATQVQSALLQEGVDVTEADILAIRDMLVKVERGEITPEQLEQAKNGELTEEMLDQVAGGESWVQVNPHDPLLYQSTYIPEIKE